MSCNGCRALRKGCSESCILRPCLHWIGTPEAQGNATIFLAKFFGRRDLMSFISAVPEDSRPALFRSLLFEACGRTVNPINGSIGLLSTGKWSVCEAAVGAVLAGRTLLPIAAGILSSDSDESSESFSNLYLSFDDSTSERMSNLKIVPRTTTVIDTAGTGRNYLPERATRSINPVKSETMAGFEIGNGVFEKVRGGERPKLLNLFV